MANQVAGERRLEAGDASYTLKFTNASYVELEDQLEGGRLETALSGSLKLGLLRDLLFIATRKFHSTDLPTLEDVEGVMDDLTDFDKAFSVLLEAYMAGQPEPAEEETNTGKTVAAQAPSEPFSWRRFLKSAVDAGIKPAEFWEMSPDEATLWIEGFDKRQDQLGQMWAHFVAPQMNIHIKSKTKKVKARDLWQSRTKKKTPAEVISIDERRNLMRELKQEIKPPTLKRKEKAPE